MLTVGQWVTWLWVLSTSVLGSSQESSLQQQNCHYVYKLNKGESIHLPVHNFTLNHYCTMQVSADRHLRLLVDLLYSPPQVAGGAPHPDCTSDYVHVGNDVEHLDEDLMTSYKFCGEDVRHEIVSSSNHMWLVYRGSRAPSDFFAKVWAQAPVTCAVGEFRCSPVQCVDRSRTCDGVKDCTNGHDEYCRSQGVDIHSHDFTEPCFRCGDGTCILPRLSRYDASYGRVLWYLCDGVSHCSDGWDEREDVCCDLATGRLGSVLRCVPSDLQFGLNSSVIMWNEVVCNSVPDCYHGDDEDNCDNRGSSQSQLHADPATVCVVTGVFLTACLLVCLIYRLNTNRGTEARTSTSSTVDTKCTLMTTSDHDRPDVTSSGPAGSQVVGINTDTILESSYCCHGNDDADDDDADDDADARSVNSPYLRHTIV